MRLRAFSRAAAAALVCIAVLASCAGEPERPTLADATRQLVSDGDALVSGIEAGLTGLTKGRADQDQNISCLQGEAQRYFTAKGSFAKPSAENPPSLVGLLKGKLEGRGYREVVDNLDLLEDDVSVSVLTHPENKLTFVLLARMDSTPNVVIVGKTECYPSTS